MVFGGLGVILCHLIFSFRIPSLSLVLLCSPTLAKRSFYRLGSSVTSLVSSLSASSCYGSVLAGRSCYGLDIIAVLPSPLVPLPWPGLVDWTPLWLYSPLSGVGVSMPDFTLDPPHPPKDLSCTMGHALAERSFLDCYCQS